MGFLTWIVLGLIAGIIAKWIMPGKDNVGFVMTILLGVGGAFVGGWVGSFAGFGSVGVFSMESIATATAGAILILFAYRLIKK